MDLLKAYVDTDRELVRKGTLCDFVEMAWQIVEPCPLVRNWHQDEIGSHLEAVSRGEILNFILNQPPGTGKSSFVNVFWPVWEWIKRPATKWIFGSFDASLVGTRDGGKCIKLIQSDWFKARWGDLIGPGKPAASSFENVKGGFRFATSVAGKVTGRHADIQVVDDPIKPKDAAGGGTMTKTALRAVSEWWSGTMATRKISQVTGRRVIVMQRLAHDDLAGEMLATGDYTHLRLPMRFEPDWISKTQWGGDRRTKAGELLFPELFPADVVTRLEFKELGPTVFAAQEQQRPQVKGGGIFKRNYFQFWHVKPGVPIPCLCEECWTAERTLLGHGQTLICSVLPDTGLEALSWDCTFDDAATCDFVAGGAWRIASNRMFLIDCINQRLDIVDTIAAIQDMARKHPRAFDKLIENKANGIAVERLLRDKIPGLVLVNPDGSKDARAAACQPEFASGSVLFPHPELAPWVWTLLKQLEGFPKATFDDMVDMVTQLVLKYRTHGSSFAAAMQRLRGSR